MTSLRLTVSGVGEAQRVNLPVEGEIEGRTHSPVRQKLDEEILAIPLVVSALATQRQAEEAGSEQLDTPTASPSSHFSIRARR